MISWIRCRPGLRRCWIWKSQPVGQLTGQSVAQRSVSQPFGQLANWQSASQPDSQSLSQAGNQPVRRIGIELFSQSVNQSTNESVGERSSQSFRRPVSQSVGQPVNQPASHWVVMKRSRWGTGDSLKFNKTGLPEILKNPNVRIFQPRP